MISTITNIAVVCMLTLMALLAKVAWASSSDNSEPVVKVAVSWIHGSRGDDIYWGCDSVRQDKSTEGYHVKEPTVIREILELLQYVGKSHEFFAGKIQSRICITVERQCNSGSSSREHFTLGWMLQIDDPAVRDSVFADTSANIRDDVWRPFIQTSMGISRLDSTQFEVILSVLPKRYMSDSWWIEPLQKSNAGSRGNKSN